MTEHVSYHVTNEKVIDHFFYTSGKKFYIKLRITVVFNSVVFLQDVIFQDGFWTTRNEKNTYQESPIGGPLLKLTPAQL